jgi:hypothetical protein
MTIRIDVTTTIRITHEDTGTVTAHECTTGDRYYPESDNWREHIVQSSEHHLISSIANVLKHVKMDFQKPSEPTDS